MKANAYPMMVWESVVRGIALSVFFLSLAGALLATVWIPLFLTVDFMIRGVLHPRYSPLAILSRKATSRLFRRKDLRIFFTPKRFAARIGLLLAGAATILYVSGLTLAGSSVMALLGLFSFLECFLRYCAGCKIFALFARHGLIDASDCPGCVS